VSRGLFRDHFRPTAEIHFFPFGEGSRRSVFRYMVYAGEQSMRNTILACIFVSACCGSYGQTGPEFEVASVKQFDRPLAGPDLSFVGTSGKPFKIAGHRVTVQGTLRTLIADAYGIKEYQISGTPPWAGTLMYAIAATTRGDTVTTQEQVRPMLQALLAERFQLKVHRETKELPVYHLTQRKTSSLLKPAAPDETFSWNVSQGPGGTLRSKATKESIGDFVQLVGVSADRPVIDETGLTGDIDYDILISPPDAQSGEDVNRAIIYAVIDQLGLKLEPAKDSTGILVVDRVDKPADN
jgi:uncharacterized protein (TIGR03435 family)